MSTTACDLQQSTTISCFHLVSASQPPHTFTSCIFAPTYILESHQYSILEQQKHIYALYYGQKTRNKQFLHFVESVLTSICGGAQYYVLRYEFSEHILGKNSSDVCLSETKTHVSFMPQA